MATGLKDGSMGFWDDVSDLRAATQKKVEQERLKGERSGFWDEVKELKAATERNMREGRGKRSLIDAVEQIAAQAAEPQKPRKPRHFARTFALSALFGAFWAGSRRR